ncbi:MAG: hypothetical protein QOE60_2029 [Thermoleophilaceae bacterium]|jgi:uncharacterized protein involved in exopolysaccharide biosynthesis|nr:hypothetical protein [Thermoleophilaceae bacterium]
MDLVALSARLAKRWWLVLGLAVVAALGAATAGSTKTDEHQLRIQFVLRPDASVTNDELPGTLEALKSDGTLVQTVIGVLRNRALLRRAAADADVTLTPDYTVESSVQPGSTLVDSTLTGPDRAVLDRLAGGYSRQASIYVTSSYPAYVLERLSADAAPAGSGPGTGQIVILAFLLGGALGVVLVAAEQRLEPQLQRRAARQARSAADEPEPAPAVIPPRARDPIWRREANGGPKPAPPARTSPPTRPEDKR